MPQSKKRVNKSKADIEQAIHEAKQLKDKQARVERQKTLAKLAFPFLASLPTVYDAQTACNAIAGFIKLGLDTKEKAVIVNAIEFDLSKSEDSVVKDAVQNILGLVEHENAKEVLALFEIMGNKLPEFIAARHMKDPMTSVTVEEFIA